MNNGRRQVKPRHATSGLMPPGMADRMDWVEPNAAGTRAERRMAKRLGVKVRPAVAEAVSP